MDVSSHAHQAQDLEEMYLSICATPLRLFAMLLLILMLLKCAMLIHCDSIIFHPAVGLCHQQIECPS